MSELTLLTGVRTPCNDSYMNTTTAQTIAQAAGNGITTANVEAFAAFISAHMTEGRAPIHAAQAAAKTDRDCSTKFFNDPAYRRAVVATLAATYDEFRTEAEL